MVTRPIHNPLEDLSINSRILGMNITGAKTSAVYGDMNGLIYERMQMETPADRPFLEGFDAVCAQADKLMKVCRAQGLAQPGGDFAGRKRPGEFAERGNGRPAGPAHLGRGAVERPFHRPL